MLSDLIITLRRLKRTPLQTVIAVLTLALGIGLSVTMCSLLKALVLAPFNYPQPDRIVQIWGNIGEPLSGPDLFDLYKQSTCFESFGAYEGRGTLDVGGTAPMTVRGIHCSAGVLPVLGIKPLIGRWFGAQDELRAAPPVMVISHALWQRAFGSDAGIIGRHVPVNGRDTEIVGVMPRDFEFRVAAFNGAEMEECALWRHQPIDWFNGGTRNSKWAYAVARLKDGVSLGAADAELKTIADRLAQTYPGTNEGKTFNPRELRSELIDGLPDAGLRGTGRMSWMLFGAGVFVLLVACANVASMVVAKGMARQQEFAVRLALGTGRWHVLRLLLMESGVLALAGALGGLAFAAWGTSALAHLAPIPAGRVEAIRVDGVMLLFSMGLVLVSTPLVGLPLAFATRDVTAADVLRTGGRGQAGAGSRLRLLGALVIGQVAIALLLANTAVLFSTSHHNVMASNAHMATSRVVSGSLTLQSQRYARAGGSGVRVRFVDQLLDRLRGLPGVEDAAVTTKLPLEGGRFDDILAGLPGQERQINSVERSWVSPEYFHTIGLRLLNGRTFGPGDHDRDKPGVVINRALAEMAWPDADPLGQTFKWPPAHGAPDFEGTVVGVVENMRQHGAEAVESPEIYFSYASSADMWVWLVVRSAIDGRSLGPHLQREVAALDPDLPLGNLRTLRDILDTATQQRRFIATIMELFAVCTVGLTMVGIYGTLSYYVAERTREIGVRMALGATRGSVTNLVLRRVGGWLCIGLALGVGGVFGAAWVLRSMLYEIQPVHPPVLIASVALVLLAGLAAGLAPALRATKIEPLEALRAE